MNRIFTQENRLTVSLAREKERYKSNFPFIKCSFIFFEFYTIRMYYPLFKNVFTKLLNTHMCALTYFLKGYDLKMVLVSVTRASSFCTHVGYTKTMTL